MSRWRYALLGAMTGGLLLSSVSSRGGSASPQPPKPVTAPAEAAPKPKRELPGELQVPPPPFSEGVFPCSDCHEKGAEYDRTRRDLSQHDFALKHDAEHRWCLDCHDGEDRDRLRLASGEQIEFPRVYKLCGQCHGDKYRDWKAGVQAGAPGSGTARSSTSCACTVTARTRRSSSRSSLARAHETGAAAMKTISLPVVQESRARNRRPRRVARGGAQPPSVPALGGRRRGGGVGALDLRLHDELFRAHFRELSKEELQKIISKLERKYSEKYGKAVAVGARSAMPGVEFGIRAGSLALHRLPALRVRLRRGEQPVPRPADPMDSRFGNGQGKGRRFHGRRRPTTTPEKVPRARPLLHAGAVPAVPRTRPAPRSARSGPRGQEPDGIVVIDYDWCIGCRCCMAACPYGARHFNWGEPDAAGRRDEPEHALPGQPAAARRAWWRSAPSASSARATGRYPACVEACPTGARKFGNLLDPDSEIRYILENKRVLRAQGGAEHHAQVLLLLRHVRRSQHHPAVSCPLRDRLRLVTRSARQPRLLGLAGVSGAC